MDARHDRRRSSVWPWVILAQFVLVAALWKIANRDVLPDRVTSWSLLDAFLALLIWYAADLALAVVPYVRRKVYAIEPRSWGLWIVFVGYMGGVVPLLGLPLLLLVSPPTDDVIVRILFSVAFAGFGVLILGGVIAIVEAIISLITRGPIPPRD